MAEAPVKIQSIARFTTSVGDCTLVFRFKEEFVMEIEPQFIPNTFQGLSVKQDHKWRLLTIVVDSETNIFDGAIEVTAENDPFLAGNFWVEFVLADEPATVERWAYQPTLSYIIDRNEGRIHADIERDTLEYVILTYGTKTITHPP